MPSRRQIPDPRRRDRWTAAALAVVCAALLVPFVGYGFNLEDEGLLLLQIARTSRGEVPYLDFNTGYTPGAFAANAALFRWFASPVVAVRLLLVAVHCASALLIFRLSRRFAPRLESAFAGLAGVVFIPFFVGKFSAANIPYPAWYAGCAALAAELAVLRGVEARRRGWLVAAGAAAGLAFFFKPTTGLLAFGATALAAALAGSPPRGRWAACAELVLVGAALTGLTLLLGAQLVSRDTVLLLAPPLLLAAGLPLRRLTLARAASSWPGRSLGAWLADLVAAAAGFALPTAPWLAFYLARVDAGELAQHVLLLGTKFSEVYQISYPPIAAPSALLLLALVAAWILPASLPHRARRSAAAILALAALGAGLGLAWLARAEAPEGRLVSIRWQLETASFFAVPALLSGAAALWLARLRVASRAATARAADALAPWSVALVFAVYLFLQVHPRIDFMHLVVALPATLVLAAAALWRLELRWMALLAGVASRPLAAHRLRRLVRGAALTSVAAALALRALPCLEARFRLSPGLEAQPLTALHSSLLPVAVERERDQSLRQLRAVVTAVRSSTRPDEPVLAFPALALVPFLADRRTPSADDYFFPGDPDHAGEAALIDALETTRTPLLVAFDRPGYFAASQAYYFLLRDYVRTHFVALRRLGAVDLFVRREAADAPAGAPRAQLEPAAPRRVPFASRGDRPFVRRARRIAAHGRRADLFILTPGLVDVDRSVRQETIAAVLRVARRDPEGLAGAAAAIAPDQRTLIVLLRALGEFAGREALPFLAAALRNDSPRVRDEAAAATKLLLVRDLEERYRWSIAEPGPYWDLPALPAVDLAERLAPGADERSATLAALTVAHEGRREARPALERLLAEPTTPALTRLFVVAALVRLGERGAARQLVALAGSALAAPYALAMLLDESIVPRSDAAAAIAASLREGDVGEREAAAWASRVLGDASPAEAVRKASADPSSAVRRAVGWALPRRETLAGAARSGDVGPPAVADLATAEPRRSTGGRALAAR